MKHQRKSIRLQDHDYGSAGWCFVTICTKGKKCIFGEVKNDVVQLNEWGKMAEKCWKQIPEHFSDVRLHEFIIMPNHVHGIIEIVGVQNFEPLRKNKFQKIIPRSLGSIIRGYKIGVTKLMRKKNPKALMWQRNFYDRIIRNEEELTRIREYIVYNPFKWDTDEDNPKNFKKNL